LIDVHTLPVECVPWFVADGPLQLATQVTTRARFGVGPACAVVSRAAVAVSLLPSVGQVRSFPAIRAVPPFHRLATGMSMIHPPSVLHTRGRTSLQALYRLAGLLLLLAGRATPLTAQPEGGNPIYVALNPSVYCASAISGIEKSMCGVGLGLGLDISHYRVSLDYEALRGLVQLTDADAEERLVADRWSLRVSRQHGLTNSLTLRLGLVGTRTSDPVGNAPGVETWSGGVWSGLEFAINRSHDNPWLRVLIDGTARMGGNDLEIGGRVGLVMLLKNL
jgi:hypothetical protein